MSSKLTTCLNCHMIVTPINYVKNQLGMICFLWGMKVCPNCQTVIEVSEQ